MRRAARAFAASLAVAWLGPASALAAEPAELEWQTPRGCPSRESVLSEVARLVATTPTEPLQARAVVTRSGPNYEVVLELAGAAQGVRTLRARTCESVARATALIIALAIDPQAAAIVSEETEPEPVPPPAPAPAPAIVRPAPAPEAPAPREQPAPAVRTVGHLGFVGENSLLPRFSLGGEVAAGLAWRSLVSELAIGIVPRATAALADRPDVSAQFELVFLAWRTCGGFRGEVLSLLGCATLRGSRLFARGQGASPSFEETAHVPSLEPGVLFRAPSGGIGVEAAASLVVPLRRPRFVILDGESERELFQPAAAGVVLRLAAGYEF